MAPKQITGASGCLRVLAALSAASMTIAGPTPAFGASSAIAPSSQDAVQALLQGYLAGFRDGNAVALGEIFAEGSVHVLRNRDQDSAVIITPISERIKGWTSSPDPGARLENVRIAFTGTDLASASFTLHYRGNVFDDQLNIYRFGDTWKVGVKVTSVRPKT
jgi:hypothetical protein